MPQACEDLWSLILRSHIADNSTYDCSLTENMRQSTPSS